MENLEDAFRLRKISKKALKKTNSVIRKSAESYVLNVLKGANVGGLEVDDVQKRISEIYEIDFEFEDIYFALENLADRGVKKEGVYYFLERNSPHSDILLSEDKMELLAQGAEAKIFKRGDSIIKERIKKSYRLAEIDQKLRKTRTRREAKLLSEAGRLGVPVPSILDINEKKMSLEIGYIEGIKVRDWLEKQNGTDEARKILADIGKLARKLHNGGIIHGDLTTSNLILLDRKVYFIDFGLGQFSDKLEDKAVDIHVFKECLKSKHHKHWLSYWKAFKDGYKDEEVLHHLEKVEARARYKKIS